LDPLTDEFDVWGGQRRFFRRHALGVVFGGDGLEEQTLARTACDDRLVTAAAFEHGSEVGEVQVGLLLVFAVTFEAMLAEDGLDVLIVGDDGISG
jgi:hypothetical protein